MAILLALSVLMPTVVPSALAADLPAPVAHWTFDEGAGKVAADSAGSGLHASVDRDGWVADGVYGSGINGRKARPIVHNASALNPETITAALWVRGNPADPPKTGSTILEVGNRGDCRAAWGIYVSSTGLGLTHVNDFGDKSFTIVHPPIIEVHLWDGLWHHVAISAQQGTGRINFIIDGYERLGTTTPWAPEYEAIVDPAVTFGAGHAGCPTKIFSGDLDDVRIYDQVLTRHQVGLLMPPIPTTTMMAGPVSLMSHEQGCFVAHTAPEPEFGSTWIVDETGVPVFGARPSTCAEGPEITAWLMSWPAAGTYFVRGQYNPGAPYLTSESELIQVVVHKQPTTVHVSGGVGRNAYDVDVDVTAPYSSVGGFVTLYETTTGSDVLIGTAELQTAGRTFFIPDRPPGTYTFRAEYAESAGFESSSGEGSVTVPGGTVVVDDGAATTTDSIVALDVTATGAAAVQVSNDGDHYRTFDPYQPLIEWDITGSTYGGTNLSGLKTVWVRWGNADNAWSAPLSATIAFEPPGPPAPSPNIPVSPPDVSFEAPATVTASGDIPIRASWSRLDGGTNDIFYDVELSTDGGPFVNIAPGIDTASIVRSLPAGH
ncbi:MAG TPA: LamG-like jellyroll fold domain-containing protein, partial [Candidatus Limnocylindrales bacterium]